ncbi:unnamed protein product [Notodromas monacha]|uniref:Transmembrane protein 135 N-terminal domain-containing protein n=1 Tax=Notodromas monacha TaxID=399045 RepID=A0A7R9BIG8_9CRUS|nr:unnamed protein product [Notodromas monacha]CAG0916114.1 unnamed protein product [Notodromas monacha]
MSILSKPVRLNFSCYDVGHTWSPHCTEASLKVGCAALIESLKIYGVVYFVSTLIQRKRFNRDVLKGILQSSCFLSFNGYGFILFFCISRWMFGGLTVWSSSYIPAFLASLTAIFIEQKNRRKMLSLYVANVASETLLLMARNRGWPVPTTESLLWPFLFSILVAASVHMEKRELLSKGIVSSFLRFVVGRKKITPSRVVDDDIRHGSDVSSLVSCTNRRRQLDAEFRAGRPTVSSKQSDSGLQLMKYCIKGFAYPFVVASGLSVVLRFLSKFRNILKSPVQSFKSTLTDPGIYKLGLFLGSFTGVFRVTISAFRLAGIEWSHRETLAGFLAGLSMMFYRSTNLVIYLWLRVLEGFLKGGISAGIVPSVPGFTEALYAISTALLLGVSVIEPHNLKPSYWKFLNRLTWGFVGQMNRRLMDPLGYESSKMDPDFWPHYDKRFISSALRSFLTTGIYPVS